MFAIFFQLGSFKNDFLKKLVDKKVTFDLILSLMNK
jgi:hypothetical protein